MFRMADTSEKYRSRFVNHTPPPFPNIWLPRQAQIYLREDHKSGSELTLTGITPCPLPATQYSE